ncbi:MAG: hypothetical protein LBD45_04955 [Bacteroidales bacterium]|jgi:hypothetical protein|nr:hypothetical protein [Bacteroidales bacterium]
MNKLCLNMVMAATAVVLFTGCAIHSGVMENSVALSANNFRYIQRNVEATASVLYVFGIGGLNEKAIVNSAKSELLERYPLRDNQALANISVSWKTMHILFFATKKYCTISADIVEFTNAAREEEGSMRNTYIDNSAAARQGYQSGNPSLSSPSVQSSPSSNASGYGSAATTGKTDFLVSMHTDIMALKDLLEKFQTTGSVNQRIAYKAIDDLSASLESNYRLYVNKLPSFGYTASATRYQNYYQYFRNALSWLDTYFRQSDRSKGNRPDDALSQAQTAYTNAVNIYNSFYEGQR